MRILIILALLFLVVPIVWLYVQVGRLMKWLVMKGWPQLFAKESELCILLREQNYFLKHHVAKVLELEEEARQLSRLATEDPLTGLVNRRGLEQRFQVAYNTLVHTLHHHDEHRKHPQMAGLLIDVDFFKKINDSYGHAAGDQVLVRVAQLIVEHFGHRPSDILCRFGGEEFLVLLPQADARLAYEKAEAFLADLRTTEVFEGKFVTASIGVAAFEIEIGVQPLKMLPVLYEAADSAMYKAKETGRNRVVMHIPRIP